MSEIILSEVASVTQPASGFVSIYPDTTANPNLMIRDDTAAARTILDNSNTVSVSNKLITLPASTTTTPSMLFTTGAIKTSGQALGDVEFDGTNFYHTIDLTSGRQADVMQSVYRITANLATRGGTIADYFDASSAFPTVASAVYELDYYLWFLKNTAGTLTFTLTNTQAYTNLVGSLKVSGDLAVAAGTQEVGLVTTTTAAAAFPVTGTLADAKNHFIHVHALAEIGTAGNIRPRVTVSAGTITPLRGSYYTARRLFAGNVGTFAA